MATVTHKKVSAVADGADTSVVRPSDWNDTHDVTLVGADIPANHSGSTHAATQAAAEATAATALSGHTGDTSDAHDASAISFSPTGTIAATDVQAAIAEVASEAGGAAPAVTVTSWHIGAFASTNSHATTITAATVGQRIIVAVASYNRDVNTPTCTNTTFTEVLAASFTGNTANLSVFVGVVAGGSSGTTVTVTAGSADFIFTTVIIIDNALTPTVVDTATKTGTSASADSGSVIGVVDCAKGDLLIFGFATNDASQLILAMNCNSPLFLLPPDSLHGLRVAIGLATSTKAVGYYQGGTGGADYAAGIVAVS